MNGPCPEMRDKIVDMVLGGLAPNQAEAVQRHLTTCAPCQAYAQSLQRQDETLVGLGDAIKSNMAGRRERAIQAFEAQAATPNRTLWPGRWGSVAAAALILLGVGIAIGRLTAPKPVDVEQLRTDLQTALTASLQPAIQQATLAEVDRRVATSLATGQTQLKTEIVELMRADLRTFATDVVANSEQMMDRRFDEFVRLVEAARLKDRQRVVQAFEQVELNRRRDRNQIGQGLKSLVALTGTTSSPTKN
jgi:anti-sigma factor RsiW